MIVAGLVVVVCAASGIAGVTAGLMAARARRGLAVRGVAVRHALAGLV